jgi:hypothetical protein
MVWGPSGRGARCVAAVLLTAAAAATLTVSAPPVLAAGTVLFSQPFHDNTVDGPAGSVSLPTGTNAACLTAAGNASANPLASCTTATDPQGSGKLRLTPNTAGQKGAIFAGTSVPTSQGLDATFNTYQYGSVAPNAADGMAFVLAAVDPANPVTPTATGPTGGSLGYSAFSTASGLTDGYMAVGLDAFGNFSNGKSGFEGSGCTDPANIASRMPGQVVIRGPGNGTVGYCALNSSAATATSPALTLAAVTRAASVVPVEVVINPTAVPLTTPSGLTAAAGGYAVRFTPIGGTAQTLAGSLPTVPSGLYPSSWLNSSGIPRQLAFGWVASTGAVTNYHEIDNVVVNSLSPVPQLTVSQTSYASTLTAGSPVTYTVTTTSTGATENQPVTVTQTLPSGVVPVAASGAGWTCSPPSGQQISCTSGTSPFTSGTITVNAVIASSSVTSALITGSTAVVASSADGGPATSSSAPAGTVPAGPTVTSISPANGAAGGGGDVKITGTNLGGATAVEIGTPAEFAAGKPTALALCAVAAPGCFTVVSGTTLDISSMPAHVAGTVAVKVVSLGIAGVVSYTYNSGPALLPQSPANGEVGLAYSFQVAVTGGTAPFTWAVSAGSLPPGITLSSSGGLLSGTPTAAGSSSFTVKVTDSAGLSASQAMTLTVIAAPSLSFPAPPQGWTNTVYGDTLTVSGGLAPYAWSVSAGSLPPGISLGADGVLSGTPTATGTYSFTIQVTDANGKSATQAASITVAAGVTTTFAAPPAATLGSAYSDTLTATGGTTPYAWSVNAGTLPPGITLSAGGVLSGTPTATGSFTFTVNVIDANKGIATTAITLTVGAGVLRMTAPAAVVLPSVAPGGTTSGTLGTVTVTDGRGLTGGTWTATVSATAPVTGGGSAAETIPLSGVTYWSGPATATTGTGTFTPGQLTVALAVTLTTARTAFSLTGGSAFNSASWTPTVSVAVPARAVGGSYVATITESVS